MFQFKNSPNFLHLLGLLEDTVLQFFNAKLFARISR